MASDNPLWGRERIRGELLKLGLIVSARSIRRYRRPRTSLPPSLDFDARLGELGIRGIRTPVLAPTANAVAERKVRTFRRECLDHLIVLNQDQLLTILNEFVAYYNRDGLEVVSNPPTSGKQPSSRTRTSRPRFSELLGGPPVFALRRPVVASAPA